MEEAILQNKDKVDINIGIGTLTFLIKDNSISYGFVPSSKLEKGLVSTIVDKKNPLTNALEDALAKRILKTYKDML